MKLPTFSTAKKTKNEKRTMRDSESTSKIKLRLALTLFKILLMSAVTCIQHGNEIANIFKSKDFTKLNKPILESSYKVLLEEILFVTLKQFLRFLWSLKFLATFNLQIVITLPIFWKKLQKNIF